MNIVPQNVKIEAQNILKNVATSVFLQNTSFLTNLFISPFSCFSLLAKLKEMILRIYQKSIALIDKFFLDSDYRKKHYYKSSVQSRTIITIFGELQFDRTYYVDKNKENGFFFIDEFFHFEAYTTYDPIVRSIFIDRSIDTNSNNASTNSNLNLFHLEKYLSNDLSFVIPRQTIYHWIHHWNLPKVQYDYYDDHYKNLYVMVDEKWIHEQIRLATLSEDERKKHHYIMSKCFVTFTGAKTKNNRTALLNRHIFLTTSNRPWKDFIDEIYNIYNYENFEEIYLLSDSGTWILSGANELKLFPSNKVIRNTCEFHVKQYINRFTRDKDKRHALCKIIYEDKDKKLFIKIANKIIEASNNKSKKEHYKNYILKHWKTILNMKDRTIKSSMESHISHCVASVFGSRPKGYSRTRIEKYIKLQEYKLNGINIMDLYLQSYNQDDSYTYNYNKNEISYSMFEHNTSIIPYKSSSNPISFILNSFAYNF